jgi:hypothetical protein
VSGGNLDYLYERITELSELLHRRLGDTERTWEAGERGLVRLFARSLDETAEVARQLEWYWSGDTGPADALAAVRKAVAHVKRDACAKCGGEQGGVPGNENIIEGDPICDYCHSLSMTPGGAP